MIHSYPTKFDYNILFESVLATDEEKNFRENLAKGYGVGSPLHKLLLFSKDNKEEDVRVTFYRDPASWCK